MVELEEGQICAACVPYNQSKQEWIIAKIEKILPDGDFEIRDEYADSAHDERYTVKPNKITQFPSKNTDYKPNDPVLALWYEKAQNMWSTMFYEATVKEKISDQSVLIEFDGSSLIVQIDVSKLAKFPQSVNYQDQNGEPPRRHIEFTSNPIETQTVNFKRITNEDFDRLMPPNIPIKRLHSVEGTPLLNFLNDTNLFTDVNPHITTCGSLSIPNARRAIDRDSALMNPDVHVGRISRILYEWQS